MAEALDEALKQREEQSDGDGGRQKKRKLREMERTLGERMAIKRVRMAG